MTITLTLPDLYLNWTAAAYDPGVWTFDAYIVERRLAASTDPWGSAIAAGDWLQIARIENEATTEYTDRHVASATEYEYAISWWGDNGVDLVQSARVISTPTEVTWRFAMLHEVGNPGVYIPLMVPAMSRAPEQEQVRLRARGRRAGTTFVGEALERALDLTLAPEYHHDGSAWAALELMLDRQYTHNALFCLRPSHSRDVLFGTIEEIARSDRPALYDPALRFRESFYDEGAA